MVGFLGLGVVRSLVQVYHTLLPGYTAYAARKEAPWHPANQSPPTTTSPAAKHGLFPCAPRDCPPRKSHGKKPKKTAPPSAASRKSTPTSAKQSPNASSPAGVHCKSRSKRNASTQSSE